MLGKLTKFGLAAVVAGSLSAGAAFAQDGKTVKIGWAPGLTQNSSPSSQPS